MWVSENSLCTDNLVNYVFEFVIADCMTYDETRNKLIIGLVLPAIHTVRWAIPILCQQRDWVGRVIKMAIFADVQYYSCWRRVSGWVRKSPKYAEAIKGWSLVPYQLSTTKISLNPQPAELFVVSITPIIDLFFDETMLSKLSNAQKDVTSAGVSGAAAALWSKGGQIQLSKTDKAWRIKRIPQSAMVGRSNSIVDFRVRTNTYIFEILYDFFISSTLFDSSII